MDSPMILVYWPKIIIQIPREPQSDA